MKANPKYVRALKTLDSKPREIEAAEEQYRADLDGIRKLENTGNWSRNAIEKMRNEAFAKKDSTVKAAVTQIREALPYAREINQGIQLIDIDDVSLQNAVRLVESTGKRTSPTIQASIVEKFRGNPTALEHIADLFEKYGLYFAAEARDMSKQKVNAQAFENLELAVTYYDALGRWEPDKYYWTRNEFSKALQHMSDNADNSRYTAALQELKEYGKDELTREAAADALAAQENGGMSKESTETLKKGLDLFAGMVTGES